MKILKGKIIASIFVVSLLFAGVLKTDAQNAEIGFQLMPTFTSFDLQTSSGGTVKGDVSLGIGIGGILGYHFSDNVGIQAEILYNSLSQKYTETDVEHKVNLRYINIPLLLSLNTGINNLINFNMAIGPQIGISAGSNLQTSGSDGTNPAVLSVKKGDLGFAYGAGFDFGLNPERTTRLGIGFRGVYGLIDISDHSNTIATDAYYILDMTKINTNAAYIKLSLLF